MNFIFCQKKILLQWCIIFILSLGGLFNKLFAIAKLNYTILYYTILTNCAERCSEFLPREDMPLWFYASIFYAPWKYASMIVCLHDFYASISYAPIILCLHVSYASMYFMPPWHLCLHVFYASMYFLPPCMFGYKQRCTDRQGKSRHCEENFLNLLLMIRCHSKLVW